MAYNDPYAHQYGQHAGISHSDPHVHGRPQSTATYVTDPDPYGDAPLGYPTYDADGRLVNPQGQGQQHPGHPGRFTSYDTRDEKAGMGEDAPSVRYRDGTGAGGYGEDRPMSQWTIPPPPKSTGILRMWRKENRASWVKGGGLRTCCRMFSCCFLSFIFILISVILTILLWVRPPDITLSSVSVPSNAVALTTSGLTFDVNLLIAVSNPNWFSANFQKITAVARYPGTNTNNFGGGSRSDIKFAGNAETTFTFPFVLNYTLAQDPNQVILKDLLAKCSTNPPSDITVDYTLTLALKIIAFVIKPAISSSATFQCPISAGDLSGLGGLLTGGG